MSRKNISKIYFNSHVNFEKSLVLKYLYYEFIRFYISVRIIKWFSTYSIFQRLRYLENINLFVFVKIMPNIGIRLLILLVFILRTVLELKVYYSCQFTKLWNLNIYHYFIPDYGGWNFSASIISFSPMTKQFRFYYSFTYCFNFSSHQIIF